METDSSGRNEVLIEIGREGELWIAQCVEHDLVTQAASPAELLYEIELMVLAHIASCEALGTEPLPDTLPRRPEGPGR